MVLKVFDGGRDNYICIADDVLEHGMGTVSILGDDNRICISPGSVLTGANIRLESHCTVSIEATRLAASEIFCASGSRVSIGRNSAFTWRSQILAHEENEIRIGEGCLFAPDTVVTVSDMHSIIDLDTGLRINSGADVVIADRVWLGLGCVVMKGVRIGEGSIIGAGSIVTKDIPSNSLAAGNPVRVLRNRVTWAFDLL